MNITITIWQGSGLWFADVTIGDTTYQRESDDSSFLDFMRDLAQEFALDR